jgi:hypothetical protein
MLHAEAPSLCEALHPAREGARSAARAEEGAAQCGQPEFCPAGPTGPPPCMAALQLGSPPSLAGSPVPRTQSPAEKFVHSICGKVRARWGETWCTTRAPTSSSNGRAARSVATARCEASSHSAATMDDDPGATQPGPRATQGVHTAQRAADEGASPRAGCHPGPTVRRLRRRVAERRPPHDARLSRAVEGGSESLPPPLPPAARSPRDGRVGRASVATG